MFGWAQMGLCLIGPPARIIFYIERNINSEFNIAMASLTVWFNQIWSWASAGLYAASPWAITEIMEFETFSLIEKREEVKKKKYCASQTAAVAGTNDNNPISCAAEVH